jgi:hypothetical protein
MAEAARLDDLADSLPPPAEAADVGGDNVNADDTVNGGAPPEAEPPSPSASDDADPLDRLLAQWDERNGAGNNGAAAGDADADIMQLLEQANSVAAREAEWQAQQQKSAADLTAKDIDLARSNYEKAELNGTVQQLQNIIQQEQFRQHQAREAAELENLIGAEQAKLEGADVPADFARRWILSEASLDPALREAWDSRNFQGHDPVQQARIAADIGAWGNAQARLALQLPDANARIIAQRNIESSMRAMWQRACPDPAAHRAAANRYLRQTLSRMHEEARRRPPPIDELATADRLAVAAAVRGASASKPPPDPPVNLGRMTAGEFARHTMERYGF